MRRGIISCLSVTLFLGSIATANAHIKADTFTITPIIGGYTFDGEQHLDTMPVVGLRGGYNLTDRFGAEIAFDYVRTDGTKADNDTNLYNYHMGVLYHFSPSSQTVPFVMAGVGGATLDGATTDKTRLSYNYGLGVKYSLTDRMHLRGEVRHLLYRNNEHTNNNVEYGIGVGIGFGASKPAAKPIVAAEQAPAAEIRQRPPLPAPAAPLAPERRAINLDIRFDTGQAEVKKADHDEIGRVAAFLKEFPGVAGTIEGHTDNVGNHDGNVELSRRRADAVLECLVEKYGIDRSRLSAVGYGPDRPVATNETPKGRLQNRRIVAIFETMAPGNK